jgi:tetratricopeptide (TPR) repeat protein
MLYGIALWLGTHDTKAISYLQCCENISPNSIRVKSDIGLAQLLQGKSGRAIEVLSEVCHSKDSMAIDFNRLGAACLTVGKYEGAGEAFQEAVFREPTKPEWYSNLGGVRARQFRLDEALQQYERALQLDPENVKIQQLRDKILIGLDRPDELVAQREKEVLENPKSIQSYVKLARAQDLAEQPDAAIETFQTVFQRLESAEAEDAESYDQAQLRLELARRMTARARYPIALRLIAQAETDGAETKTVALARAHVFMHTNAAERALEALDAVPDDEVDTAVKLARGQALGHAGRYEESEAELRALADQYPGHPGVLTSLGQTLLWTGRINEAADLFERAGEINPTALANLVNAKEIPNDPNAIARMERFANNPFVPDAPKGAMAFALAKVHEKRKDPDTAFSWLDEANKRTGKTVRYDPDNHSRYIDQLIETWTPEVFERLAGTGRQSSRPIFVVGMPRSGTTLTETILGSHADIYPAGELPLMATIINRLPKALKTTTRYPQSVAQFTPRTIDQAAKYYLREIRNIDDTAKHVVDKMPHNLMSLGLIALMFPNARIIHVNRDPRDTALSNYQQNFMAKHGMLGYSVNLEWTAQHINDYHRLMQHWRKVLPVEIFELEYEALVQDQEATTLALLDFVGVEWDESVRDFYKTERAVRTASVTQVRQPIYKTSSQKWRKYEKHLKPLLDNLNPETYARYDAAYAETQAVSDDAREDTPEQPSK